MPLEQAVADQSTDVANQIMRAGNDSALAADTILDEVCKAAQASGTEFRSVFLVTNAVAKWAVYTFGQLPTAQPPQPKTTAKVEVDGMSTGAFSSIADNDSECPTPDNSIGVRYRVIGANGSGPTPSLDLLINHVRIFCHRTRLGISLTVFVSLVANRASDQSDSVTPATVSVVIQVERPDGSALDTRSVITFPQFLPARQFKYALLKENLGFQLIGKVRAEDFKIRVMLD
jgi:hypothetical protein